MGYNNNNNNNMHNFVFFEDRTIYRVAINELSNQTVFHKQNMDFWGKS